MSIFKIFDNFFVVVGAVFTLIALVIAAAFTVKNIKEKIEKDRDKSIQLDEMLYSYKKSKEILIKFEYNKEKIKEMDKLFKEAFEKIKIEKNIKSWAKWL